MRRFFIGFATGAVAGYTALRLKETIADLRDPAPPLEREPAAYGGTRRALMLAGMARSLATLAAAAYVVGPRFEPPEGARESRARRLALVTSGLFLSTLVESPADYVEGFVLERRYGLSKQTAREWLLERGKSLAVSLAIGVPLVEALATAVAHAPKTWPVLATAGSLPLLVLGSVVAPAFIAPLFNTFEPLEGPLLQDVRALAQRYGAGDATVLRVDMSRQTEKANAYVTGLFGTKRIVIGDTLLDRFAPNETLFVVAHELGHYVAGDVWRGVGLGTAAAASIFWGSRLLAERSGRALSSSAGLARLFFSMSLLGTLSGPLLATFSRSRERAADEFALAATGDGAGGAAAFTRLRERNLAEDEQPRWMELLFSTHPSLRSRITRLEAASAR